MASSFFQIKAPVPCVQGFYGDRLNTYSTQIPAEQIAGLLGHDPRSDNWKRLPKELGDIYKFLQRPTSKSRRESVAGYIEERFGPDAHTIGAFPAISIAFMEPLEFEQFEGKPGVGNVLLDMSPSVTRVLIDGLGRMSGIMEFSDKGLSQLLKFQVPLTLFAPKPGQPPLSWQEMGQLFHDFNFRVSPVPQRIALALDTADPYINLARTLADYSFLSEHGGVAERMASLGSKSTELVVQTVWVRTVRGACEGRRFQEANLAHADEPNLTDQTEEDIRASIASFFQAICDEMGDDRWTDRDSVHLTSPGWQALGVIHHDVAFRVKSDPNERAKITHKIAEIDWSRYNPDWLRLGIGIPEIDKKTGAEIVNNAGQKRIAFTGAGRTNTQALITYVRQKSGLDLLLKDEIIEGVAEKLLEELGIGQE